MQNVMVDKKSCKTVLSGSMLMLACYFALPPVECVSADFTDAGNEKYQPLEYIAATGSQWIVTDIRPTCTDSVKMKFRLSVAAGTRTQALYCSRTKMTENTFTAFYIDNVARCDRNLDSSTEGDTSPTLGADTVFEADYSTRKFSVDGIEQSVQMAAGDFTPGSVLMLFASHKDGNALAPDIASADVDNRARYRLYFFELYESGSETPKHRLVPARRRSDSAVGLFDTIGDRFYGKADNSDEFIASPSITDVTAQQHYPWNGKVDISYTVTGDIAAEANQKAVFTFLKVTAQDKTANKTYTATKLIGDTALTAGTHKFVWDMDAEGLSFKSTNVVFKVSCETTPAMYCVVDLSAGANAASYPVTYLAAPPSGGFNVDAYKTTKLVLRRLEAGTFIMGDDQTVESHRVTLTKPFFCGLFEVTQRQYSLVMGSNPCASTSYGKGNTYPVHYVSYDMIRGSSFGAKWPSTSTVDASSFLGKIQARTGLNFDLPTEAQWEYSCRAGMTTAYYWGDSMNNNYAWYLDSSGSKTHPAGTKKANAWGLYDMSGNVWEWCLDWYATLPYRTNPAGASSGSYRVLRGGCWRSLASACTSSYRNSDSVASDTSSYKGFRIVRTLPE